MAGLGAEEQSELAAVADAVASISKRKRASLVHRLHAMGKPPNRLGDLGMDSLTLEKAVMTWIERYRRKCWGWMVVVGLSAGCDALGINDCDGEAGCEEPSNGGDCGFEGPVCEQVVDCCSFIASAEPNGSAAGACAIDQSVATGHVQSGNASSSDCAAILDKAVYEGLCTSCAP